MSHHTSRTFSSSHTLYSIYWCSFVHFRGCIWFGPGFGLGIYNMGPTLASHLRSGVSVCLSARTVGTSVRIRQEALDTLVAYSLAFPWLFIVHYARWSPKRAEPNDRSRRTNHNHSGLFNPWTNQISVNCSPANGHEAGFLGFLGWLITSIRANS